MNFRFYQDKQNWSSRAYANFRLGHQKSKEKCGVCEVVVLFGFSVELQHLKSYDFAAQVQARDELEPGRAGAVGYCSTTKGGGRLQC